MKNTISRVADRMGSLINSSVERFETWQKPFGYKTKVFIFLAMLLTALVGAVAAVFLFQEIILGNTLKQIIPITMLWVAAWIVAIAASALLGFTAATSDLLGESYQKIKEEE